MAESHEHTNTAERDCACVQSAVWTIRYDTHPASRPRKIVYRYVSFSLSWVRGKEEEEGPSEASRRLAANAVDTVKRNSALVFSLIINAFWYEATHCSSTYSRTGGPSSIYTWPAMPDGTLYLHGSLPFLSRWEEEEKTLCAQVIVWFN